MYQLSCPQCGWKAQILVTADVAEKFTRETCRECQARKRPPSQYCAVEKIIVGRSGR